MMPSKPVLQALMVTAELTGTQLSEPAARVFALDIGRYPEPMVLGALDRCRREVKGRLTPADVIQRLDDGRPGPEEAWSILPFEEATTVVWTEEMQGAWGVALPLLEEGDRIAGRMAFLESYRTRVQRARDAGIPVKWTVSLGHDAKGREPVIAQAIERGRLSADHAAQLGYVTHPSSDVFKLANGLAKRLEMKGDE